MFTFEEIKEKAIPIAKKYGLDSISLFGSYARGDQNEDSDLDFLIEKGDLKGLFQYTRLYLELEKVFNCHVDVVSTEIEDKDFIKKIQKDGVLLYCR